jgi:hypothetical protein
VAAVASEPNWAPPPPHDTDKKIIKTSQCSNISKNSQFYTASPL